MDAILEPISQMRRWIEDSLWAVRNCISFRTDHYTDNIDRLAFFEELNCGWYQMYIYPYDDLYMPIISDERKLRLNERPPVIYLSAEDFDHLVERLNQPPDPKVQERFKEILNRKAPWDNSPQNNTD